LCLALALCVWATPSPGNDADFITTIFNPPDSEATQIDLSSTGIIDGGSGIAWPLEGIGVAAVQAPQPNSVETPLPLLALPEMPVAELHPGPGSGRGRGTGRGDGTGSRQPAGKNAVTEGSFTVWTIPDDPIPGETYTIMIEIRLPDKMTRFPRSDLIGLVTGTDGWRQPLPGNAEPRQSYLPVRDHTVQLQVDVPGAGRRVRDTIEVRSKLLKEKQVLTIVF
jgi:hypothetical protein